MATKSKRSVKKSQSFIEYSKKMCTRVTVFWMFYRILNFVVILLRPDVSHVLSDLVAGVDTAQICNMGFYIGKSGFENVAKIIAGRVTLNNYRKQGKSLDDEEEDDEILKDVFKDEAESNG